MPDLNRPVALVVLVLLILVLAIKGPTIAISAGVGSILRWVLFGLLIYFVIKRGGCCGRRCA